MTTNLVAPDRVLRRSMLFVPAHVDEYVDKAAGVEPDAVILDLEDAVPAAERPDARKGLAARAARLVAVPRVMVRVNAGHDLAADLGACSDAGIGEVLIPKVAAPADVDRVRDLCRERHYRPEISILIESTAGLARTNEILAAHRVETVALGVEDLRAELEIHAPVRTTSETLMSAHAQLVLAALGAGVTPIGLLGSIAQYRDVAELKRNADAAWRLGYRGSYCVHPDQVSILNASFCPSEDDLAWAGRVVEGEQAARAQGRGAFVVDGDMVDAPLVARAHRILAYFRGGRSTTSSPSSSYKDQVKEDSR